MYDVRKTTEFDKWLRKLRDRRAQAKILFRIQRIKELGSFGDCEVIGEGVRELRIHYAKGYRVYFAQHKDKIILLINGGTKSTQRTDISKAKNLWKHYKSQLEDDKI